MLKNLFGSKSDSTPSSQARSDVPETAPAGNGSSKSAPETDSSRDGEATASQSSSSKKPRRSSRGNNKPKSSKANGSQQNKQSKLLDAHAHWDINHFQVPELDGKTRFHDLDLPSELMHAIADLGFEYCSPIQAAVLPHTLDGFDAVGKAQTGTGKTAAFLLAAMHECLTNPIEGERFLAEPRVVVLAPTRELVMQIAKDARDLAKYTTLGVEALVGGMDYQKQFNALEQGYIDIIAATPGRLNDFISRGHISLGMVEVLVLDEADRMLDMGFIPQVRRIVRTTPHRERRQTMLFSATFNYDVNIMIESWMIDPVRVEIEPENIAADTVDQKVYMVSSDEKYKLLSNILRADNIKSVIVFANRRDQTRDLYEALKKDGFNCGILSGEVAQQRRTRTLQQFKDGQLKVLIATDVAGRGIHIDDISHVVNYNLPEDPEDYVHRIGRTGRAGATGVSISLACEDDAFMLPDIEALLGQKLVCEQAPEDLLV